jgi:hypothetical protein
MADERFGIVHKKIIPFAELKTQTDLRRKSAAEAAYGTAFSHDCETLRIICVNLIYYSTPQFGFPVILAGGGRPAGADGTQQGCMGMAAKEF